MKAIIAIMTLLASQVIAQDNPALVTVRPLHAGVCQIGKDHVFGQGYSAADRMPFVIYSFLVETADGQKALIDLGPETLDYCNRMFLRYGFFRDLGPDASPRFPDNIVQPEGNVFAQLRRLKIPVADIDHIIFSHLHSDHHGMDDATDGGAAEDFPKAILHVSKIGWDSNLAKRKEGKWNSYVDHAFSDFLVEAEGKGRVRFHDNAQILPGVRTLYLGGHSICSQAVAMNTEDGLAIFASDDVYHYKLLEENILPKIRTSEDKYRAALNRLVDLAVKEHGIIIPSHDPIVWETFAAHGDDWLKELRPFSERAVRAYRKRVGGGQLSR